MHESESPFPRMIESAPVTVAARSPAPVTLAGQWARLIPVDPARHAAALYAASHAPRAGPELWAFMSYGPFADEAAMTAWMAGCAAVTGQVFLTILGEDGTPSGMASYLRAEPAHGSIEMGSIWLAPSLQRSRAATEAMYLMMRHAFAGLGYRRLEWKCNALNDASRRAARRLGFAFEGIFYRHMVVKGLNRDTAWYAMLDSDWPAVAAGFESWLDPANFDAAGAQIRPLGDFVERR